jgi:hypothetical protein
LSDCEEEKEITKSTAECKYTSLKYIPIVEDIYPKYEILETLYDERLSPSKIFKVKQISDD